MKFTAEATRQAWLGRVLAAGSGVAEDEARFLDRSKTRSWTMKDHAS